MLGSGKSTSMYGAAHSSIVNVKGIVQIAIEYLLNKVPNMSASFVEYYDGKWRDLGCNDRTFYSKLCETFSKFAINSISDADITIKNGIANRKTGSTDQNSFSSRSHALLLISAPVLNSKLLFVDMAGNECIVGKENKQETCFINSSLAQLNHVLACKAKKTLPIPYRNNDFTQFLQPYLLKNKAIVFYHVRPSNIAKDLLSIQEMIMVKQGPKKNSNPLHKQKNIIV